MAEMITLVDEPGTAPFAHGTRRYHAVQPFVSMDGDRPQPVRRYFADFGAAVAAALEHTFSEPWRTHAQVWTYDPDSPVAVGMIWIERDPQTREAVVGELHGLLTPEMDRELAERRLFWAV